MAEPNSYNNPRFQMVPFGMTGTPGANFGGTQTGGGGGGTGAVGGSSNPFLPTFPAGQSASSFPANTAGTTPTNLMGAPGAGGSSSSPSLGFGGSEKSFVEGMHSAGFPRGIGSLLYNFLKGGAGFNPQVAQALINSLQPQVQRGEADILEQFSAMGLRNGSPAAIGLADFLSQVNLNEQQIMAQLYQQAVQNYLEVLLTGNVKGNQKSPSLSGLASLIGGGANLISGISSAVKPTPPTLSFTGGL